MNDIIDKLDTITRQLDSIHAELASIRQQVTDQGLQVGDLDCIARGFEWEPANGPRNA
jgi:hypothetical protein